ncbi:quinone-dependent dihydroorotate dehydrogenase [Pelistega sp. NLN82]|uniref:Dihydroorotate dehydrogenase (quinone) n=1 Tax=Pelistega ratti TaxID=2652177 RepID=A0A6L9Y7D2_9BURK|nr:quinone-dependent dihydroorotate dehydrogenase [Pelistega ratti]NEN76301.1 quinone-dependent dihydroorotate dehydrogenase [Pelistega ratti]
MFDRLNPYTLARSVLFSMDAEKAHHFTLEQLKKHYQNPLLKTFTQNTIAPLPSKIMGIDIKNPVGLAAGLDKNGEFIDPLSSLGFGFIEVGTVTPRPQPGNPKPRLFRIPEKESLINRMGFNNEGLETFLRNVQQSTFIQKGGVLGLNLGKNADTPIEKASDDYLIGLEGVYPFADYITINISSPNTKNLRSLQGEDELSALLKQLQEKRLALADLHQRYVPIAIKIAPDMDSEQVNVIAHLLTTHKMDGVIATNTTLTRDYVQGFANATEAGGLSGPAVHELSLRVIETLRKALGQEFSIIGVGGIMSGQQAIEKINAGANAVQLYTGLIYKGPKLVQECVEALRG